jgi:hypothetical protein
LTNAEKPPSKANKNKDFKVAMRSVKRVAMPFAFEGPNNAEFVPTQKEFVIRCIATDKQQTKKSVQVIARLPTDCMAE